MSDRYQGAFLFSAIGDALGWPTEFLKPNNAERPPFHLPVNDYVKWNKRVGGVWWGYVDEIEAGEYSDDTQLGLSMARSIDDEGRFQPEQFAYFELPLWLGYERGGGRSVKADTRAMIQPRSNWLHNFYRRADLDYQSTGANGAAMRNLPIALASANQEEQLVVDSFLNAVTTHGHPRAIVGTILFGLAVRHLLITQDSDARRMLQYLESSLKNSLPILSRDFRIAQWIEYYESSSRPQGLKFESLYNDVVKEASSYLEDIPNYLNRSVNDYYSRVGALAPESRGSGIGTVCSALSSS